MRKIKSINIVYMNDSQTLLAFAETKLFSVAMSQVKRSIKHDTRKSVWCIIKNPPEHQIEQGATIYTAYGIDNKSLAWIYLYVESETVMPNIENTIESNLARVSIVELEYSSVEFTPTIHAR